MKIDVQDEPTYCYTNRQQIDPDKHSIVFVHGAGMDHTVWTLFARHFARHGRNVIAVDLPGHGRSGGPPKHSIGDMSDWIVELLDALQVERAAIVGHSMGGLIALDCAARHRGRVRILALVASTAPMPVAPAILNAAADDDPAAFDMLTRWGYSKRHLYGGNGNPGMWMTGGTLRLFERCRSGVLHADLNACDNYQAGPERAATVRCPVLAVLGRDDRLAPVRGTQPLLDALPSPDVRVIDAAGHTLMVEAPNALLDALKSVL